MVLCKESQDVSVNTRKTCPLKAGRARPFPNDRLLFLRYVMHKNGRPRDSGTMDMHRHHKPSQWKG